MEDHWIAQLVGIAQEPTLPVSPQIMLGPNSLRRSRPTSTLTKD
jgi:hypothetical protein